MEMSYDEVGIVDVDVNGERGQEKTRQPAHRKQADEAERVEHWRVVGYRSFIERRGPVEDLDGGGNRHSEAQNGKDQPGINGLAAHEHVVAPNQKRNDGDGHAREGHEVIAEDFFLGKARHQLADHAHRGQDHDVDRRVGVEPEKVLKENGVAAQSGIKKPHVEEPLDRHQGKRDGDDGRPQDENDAGRVDGPNKKRHAEPGQARRAHFVDGDDEIEARQDG